MLSDFNSLSHWSELIWSKMIAGHPRPIPVLLTEPSDGCWSGNILMRPSISGSSLDSGLEARGGGIEAVASATLEAARSS